MRSSCVKHSLLLKLRNVNKIAELDCHNLVYLVKWLYVTTLFHFKIKQSEVKRLVKKNDLCYLYGYFLEFPAFNNKTWPEEESICTENHSTNHRNISQFEMQAGIPSKQHVCSSTCICIHHSFAFLSNSNNQQHSQKSTFLAVGSSCFNTQNSNFQNINLWWIWKYMHEICISFKPAILILDSCTLKF